MSATIHYHDIGDYLSREEKLRIIDDFGDISAVPWQTLAPDRHGDWLNKRDSEFDNYVPLAPDEKFKADSKSWFTAYSSGLKTGRDAWAVNHSAAMVEASMKRTIAYFCGQQGKHGTNASEVEENRREISWNRSLLQHFARGIVLGFEPQCVVPYAYRPFDKQFCYFNRHWNDMTYQMPSIFPPEPKCPNKVIWTTSVGGEKSFSCFISNCIPDIQPIPGGIQCFPLYWYEQIDTRDNAQYLPGLEKQSGYIRHDAISDFILQEFRKIAGPKVEKEDIFNYVYGALHNPDYRRKFAADLKKQLPRLPLPKDKKDFEKVERIGRELANLHLHYEEIEPWPLDEIGSLDYHVTKMAWAKDGKAVRNDMLVVNGHLTLAGIPAEAHQYVVNGRTPLEWLIDRYQVRTDADSGIVNDPNKWGEEHGCPEYIVELAKRLVRLSVETVRLVGELSPRKQLQTPNSQLPTSSNTPPYWWKSGKWGVASPMPEGENAVLPVKFGNYDRIETGARRTDCRHCGGRWDGVLGGKAGAALRTVTYYRGHTKTQMTWEVVKVEKAIQPGDAGYYIIHLGKRIK